MKGCGFIACYHPLSAIVLEGKKTVNGKQALKIVPDIFFTEWRIQHGKDFPSDKVLQLPCGQCTGCRIQQSREWANRCMMELQYHDSAYFVTLTYNDAHVPLSYKVADDTTGEAISTGLTLRKRDFQLFMKRLRKKFCNDKIRFFMAGEYGSNTFRPHYHAIIYGLHLDDLVLYKKSPQGFSYYTSQSLQSVWSDDNGPIGYAVVADVSWETCAYTARYVMKKRTGSEAKFYSDLAIEPEFTLMSRKPGIARQYYDEHPGIYVHQWINLPTEKGGLKFRPPRYFDKLYDLENPDEMENIKNIRKKMAIAAEQAKLQKTSISPDELRMVEERTFNNKIKSLRRDMI